MLQQRTSLYSGQSQPRVCDTTLTHGQAGLCARVTPQLQHFVPATLSALGGETLRLEQNKQGAVHEAAPQPEGWTLAGLESKDWL